MSWKPFAYLVVAPLMLVLVAPMRSEVAAVEPTSDYIVVWRDDVDSDKETDDFERGENTRADFRYSRALKGFAAKLNATQLARLQRNPKVKFISEDREVHAIGAIQGSDSAPSGVRRIEAATGTTASDASTVAVAVIDTGIQTSHPDLNVSSTGKNCVRSNRAPNDDNGHGSHVSGTIAAKNNGSGVVGVAPGTLLHPVKVLNASGSGTWSQVICGIDWVTARASTIKVASMSLGGGGSSDNTCGTTNSDALHAAICRSVAAGVTYVVAAGNEAKDFASSVPAAYPEVLTVTAMSDSDGAPGSLGGAPTCRTGELDDASATFSNFAVSSREIGHTVAGPGVCIRSTWTGSGYNTISGTSMATPHVSGTVALCLGSGGTPGPCSGLPPASIVQKIRSDAQAHASSGSGFSGDAAHQSGAKYMGYLAYAGGFGAPDTTPPVITDVASSTTSTTATITWKTDELASSQLEYWTEAAPIAYPSAPADMPPGVLSHSLTLTGLTPGTTYNFHVISADAGGRSATSADSTFKSKDAAAPPLISNVDEALVTNTSATITWTTDVPASSKIEYWTGANPPTSTPETDTAPRVTTHSVTINNLSAGTPYGYRVKSTDVSEVTGTSADRAFTTSAGSNNGFANAFRLAVPGSVTANNRNATTETGEKLPCGLIRATVWYKITPKSAGTLTASTLGGGTSYDSVLALYSGSTLSTLTNMACNDDTGGTLQSQISATVAADTTYYVQVGGYNGSTGDFRLQLTLN